MRDIFRWTLHWLSVAAALVIGKLDVELLDSDAYRVAFSDSAAYRVALSDSVVYTIALADTTRG